ncbi:MULTISPECIES: hypothetical protein [Anaerococcus]|uniref:hypothetical protein n=1 Tax=Anaerococcus TaxID=165779 RepID=UPI001D96A01C|nr:MULTISPECIES: hypothetical protein [Anaerococcus]MBS5989731.1 hypothetical protein [Anaerococcus hydrogenalis]MDU4026701.1 hypothetical protein [Anaerococcus sp.]
MKTSKKRSKLQQAQDNVQAAINLTNITIEDLGNHTKKLYESLTKIQNSFDNIRNVPSDILKYKNFKKEKSNWKKQAENIEKEYNEALVKNTRAGAAGAGLGFAVVTLGPTAAMGVATTFGLASTGTAISALSGAAATNAALAWLGGGALVAGGGGMAAGNAFLAMAGPVGLAIAAISLAASGLLFWKNNKDKKHLENLFAAISHRDVKSYELAIVEILERIKRIDDESEKLDDAIENIKTFGLDYDLMTEKQQYTLGSYINLMHSATQLLINPIKGLKVKFSINDFDSFMDMKSKNIDISIYKHSKDLIISLANMLYKIELDEETKILLWKSLRKNKDMLKSKGISKKEFDIDIMDIVFEALEFKYKN